MPLAVYHILHLVGLILVFIGFGALLSTEGAKSSMKWHGTGLLISLVSGFGMLAKMGLFSALPVWVYIKLALWLVLGALPVLAKRRVVKPVVVVVLAAFIGATMGYLGYLKPVW
ncbi:hypothetical protein [Prosthecobacter fusiformis]|nr:hypothetical protein [Prosthecobacter fusiformis]